MVALAVTVFAVDGLGSAADVNHCNHEAAFSPCGKWLEMTAATQVYADAAAGASTHVTIGVGNKLLALGACLPMH
jgi:hypothetical protein